MSSSKQQPPTTSSPKAARGQAPKETLQMSVLGMDDTDGGLKMPPRTPVPQPTPFSCSATTALEDDGDKKMPAITPSSKESELSSAAPNSPQQTNTPMSAQDLKTKKVGVMRKKKPSASAVNKTWWEKLVLGGKPDELGRTTNYSSLGTPTSVAGVAAAAANSDSSELSAVVARQQEQQQTTLEDPANTSSSGHSKATVEDQLRQDCSFFYQGIEDPIQQKRGAAFPLSSSSSDKGPRVLSSREGALFQAKYQKLNQPIYVDDDLELTEEDGDEEVSTVNDNDTSRNISISDIQNSSLVYKQNGKLHMRLPCDQTRLIMDHDLEPGILSVEQWRCVDANEILPTGDAVATKGPPLRYVMTVPDDLYRRLVSEMSYHFDPPYAGFFRCCHESDEHADIRLALIIVTVFLILLFIGTVDVGEQ